MTPRHPFVVHVAGLRRAVGSRWHERARDRSTDLDCSGSAVPDGAEPVADVVLEAVLGGVSVTGTVRAPWAGRVPALPGTPATGVLGCAVRELYTEDGDGEETYPLVDDEVDLEPLVRDAVLLELPLAPLCRPDCLGLCPHVRGQPQRGDVWVRGPARSPVGRARRPAGARGHRPAGTPRSAATAGAARTPGRRSARLDRP